jgi:hypothetical protein
MNQVLGPVSVPGPVPTGGQLPVLVSVVVLGRFRFPFQFGGRKKNQNFEPAGSPGKRTRNRNWNWPTLEEETSVGQFFKFSTNCRFRVLEKTSELENRLVLGISKASESKNQPVPGIKKNTISWVFQNPSKNHRFSGKNCGGHWSGSLYCNHARC